MTNSVLHQSSFLIFLLPIVFGAIMNNINVKMENKSISLISKTNSTKVLDFVFPDSPLLSNASISSGILTSRNNASDDYYEDDDDKIGGSAIATILG